MAEKTGWGKLHREIMDHPVWDHDGIYKLFTFCFLEANWKASQYKVPGANELITVERGQFITGQQMLHSALYKRPTRETPTSRTVWRWLQNLSEFGCVKLMTLSNRCTIVTVVNYETYQDLNSDSVTQTSKQATDLCHADVKASDTPVSTSEEVKKGRREEGKKEGGSLERGVPTHKPSRKAKSKITPDKPMGTFLTYPCNGGTSCWHLVQDQVDVWQDLFPAIDVAQECRNVLAWCEANPAKRKTAAGMMRCITTWLTKEQNRSTQRFDQRIPAKPVSRVATKEDLENYNPTSLRD